YGIYFLFPAVGPALYLKGHYPPRSFAVDALPDGPALTDSDAPRNCMPSLHASWAISMAFHGYRLGPILRVGSLIWVVFTLLATLGLGEHYLLDLIVAAPFVVPLDCIARSDARIAASVRLRWMVVAAAIITAWLASLRFAHHLWTSQPSLLWGASIATVVFAILMRRRLAPLTSSDPVTNEHTLGDERG